MPRKPIPIEPKRKRTEKAPLAKPPAGVRLGHHPGLMTGETIGKFLALLGQGLWRDDAAALSGLGTGTLDAWVAKGKANIAAVDAELQRTGKLPEYNKYGEFLNRLVAAEISVRLRCFGLLWEVAEMRGPSAGNDAEGNPIPGPLLNPGEVLRMIFWYLSRKDNLRYGSGSQRTDLVRGGGDDDDLGGLDPGQFVLQQLARVLAAKERARADADADGISTGE